MTEQRVYEYGFALRGAPTGTNYDAMERRVRREVQEAVDRGDIEIAGDLVRAKYLGMPYVYMPVRSNIPVREAV